jgi:hypothetical protein
MGVYTQRNVAWMGWIPVIGLIVGLGRKALPKPERISSQFLLNTLLRWPDDRSRLTDVDHAGDEFSSQGVGDAGVRPVPAEVVQFVGVGLQVVEAVLDVAFGGGIFPGGRTRGPLRNTSSGACGSHVPPATRLSGREPPPATLLVRPATTGARSALASPRVREGPRHRGASGVDPGGSRAALPFLHPRSLVPGVRSARGSNSRGVSACTPRSAS